MAPCRVSRECKLVGITAKTPVARFDLSSIGRNGRCPLLPTYGFRTLDRTTDIAGRKPPITPGAGV